ncbi:MAG: glycosyltransferase [Desulfurococcales archaeon]|nr:glycosyltransferase [Desulfurococcales archaeon]
MKSNLQMNGNSYCTIAAIIPIYNEEKVIKRTIDSLLHQRFTAVSPCKLYIFMVDDASSDHTYEIIKKYCDIFGNVYCFRMPFRPRYNITSYAVARILNYILKHISILGLKIDYILVIGADLILSDYYIDKVISSVKQFEAKGEKIAGGCGVIINEPRARYIPSGAGLIIKYSLLMETGGIKPEPAEDTGIFLRLIDKGWKLVIVKNAHMYLQRPTGLRESNKRCYFQGIADAYFCTSTSYFLLKIILKMMKGKLRCTMNYVKGYLSSLNIKNKRYCRARKIVELLRLKSTFSGT